MRKSSVKIGLLLASVSLFSVAALSSEFDLSGHPGEGKVVRNPNTYTIPDVENPDFDLPIQLGEERFGGQRAGDGHHKSCGLILKKEHSLPEILSDAFSSMIRFSK